MCSQHTAQMECNLHLRKLTMDSTHPSQEKPNLITKHLTNATGAAKNNQNFLFLNKCFILQRSIQIKGFNFLAYHDTVDEPVEFCFAT